jgi:type IV pilus assembly protein PilV
MRPDQMMKVSMIKQAGFTLIEVLVSVLILSFGLLGIGGLMTFSLKANSSSYLKQQSVQAAYNIIDRMQSNKGAATAGSYNMNNLVTDSSTPTPPTAFSVDCSNGICTATQMATYDVSNWAANDVALELPNGCASVVVGAVDGNGNYPVTVTVQWDDSPAQKTLGSSTGPAALPAKPELSQFVSKTLL